MPGVLPLTILCENVLFQHHILLKDLGDTRYDLIRRVLLKCNPQQLMNLEASNPKLILDDEAIWLNLLRKDFPQAVHDTFTTNPSKIIQFFKRQLDELEFDYSDINLNNYIKIVAVGSNVKPKYRLPSKLLYLKYTEDVIKKEELAIENLRKKMRSIQQSKERTKVIKLDEVICVDSFRPRSIIRNKPRRSELFQKSQTEAKKHRENFRNPLLLFPERVVHPPQPNGFNSHSKVQLDGSRGSTYRSSERLQKVDGKVTKPTSPPKSKRVSIFLSNRPTPSKRTPPATPENELSMQSMNSMPSSNNEPTTASCHENKPTFPPHKPIRKINLGEYLARTRTQ